jgi:hypothetical protein
VNQLVPDIGEYLTVMIGNWLIDVEKELGDEIVHAQLAHLLGECCRIGDIQEHHDTLLASWPTVGSKQETAKDAAANQPSEFKDGASQQRC